MTLWEKQFHSPVVAARPFVLLRGTLLLLAADIWALMLAHGSRYGVHDFNVAQLSALDALGAPSPAHYIVTLLLAALLACAAALATPTPAIVALVALLYSYAWSMSMLTAWQHYYLVSLLLVCLAFVRPLPLRDLVTRTEPPSQKPVETAAKPRGKRKGPAPPTAPSPPPAVTVEPNLIDAWGFRLATTTVAIVYTFTAFSKVEHAWRTGAVLQMIDSQNGVLLPLRSLTHSIGIADDTFYGWMGLATIALQLVIALGYFFSSRIDASRRLWVRLAFGVAALCTVGFHLGTDALGLKIGWFSRYMILLALATFTPGAWLSSVVAFFTSPLLALERAWDAADATRRPITLGVCALSAAALVGSGLALDLPGAPGALTALGAAVLAFGIYGALTSHGERARRYGVAAMVSTGAMWLTLAAYDVRYDYYRFLGADAQRAGDLQGALDAYRKADRYAPSGESRRDRIQALEWQIEERRQHR